MKITIQHLSLCCALALSVLAGCSGGGESDTSPATSPATTTPATTTNVSTVMPPSTRTSLSDAQFAQSVFTAMATGDSSVESDIDWDNLSAGGQDVGTAYVKFASPEEKAGFRKSFLSSFAASQKAGAGAAAFSNWRETIKDEIPGQFIVIATAPNGKSLQVTTNTVNGQRKVILVAVG